MTWWDTKQGTNVACKSDERFINNAVTNEPCWIAGNSKTEGIQSRKPENEFFVATARLGKSAPNLDASENQPGIELKPAGKAEAQSGVTEERRESPEQVGNLSKHRVLQTNLTAKMPDGTALLLNVLCDTGAETDVIDLETARTLHRHGASLQSTAGTLKMLNNSVEVPDGAVRVLLSTEKTELRLPRELNFVVEPLILEGSSAPFLLGYPTLVGTGLLNVVLGMEQYSSELESKEDASELDDDELWQHEPSEEESAAERQQFWQQFDPEIDCNQYKMPKIKGTYEEQKQLAELCLQYKKLFGEVPYGGSQLPAMDIKLKRDQWGAEMQPRKAKPRRFPPWISELIEQDARMRIKNGWYRKGFSQYGSAVVAAKQPAKGPDARRICAHYCEVNDCAEEILYPVKNAEQVLAKLLGMKIFHSLDLYKGYHQVKLTEFAQELLAVVTEHGQYIPMTAPFGFHGLCSYFQWCMSEVVFEDIEGEGVETFIDDINTHGIDFQTAFRILREVFRRLEYWDLRVNGVKTVLNDVQCEFLGHIADGDGIKHTEKRISAVKKMVRPHDKKQVKAFLGLVNYFRKHLKMDFADLMAPISKLTGVNEVFKWEEVHQRNYEQILERIEENEKLFFLDYNLPIYIRCDASKLGCGAQLFQVLGGSERTVAYLSKTFTSAEQKWSVLEQELFAAFWAMKKWASRLLGHEFTVLTDHRNILQLNKAEAPKVVRWRLQMQQFKYKVLHVPGASARHAIVDCLSRLHGSLQAVEAKVNLVKTRSKAAEREEQCLVERLESKTDNIKEKEFLKKGKDTELTPEIVNLIRKYHNSVAGHVGENKTMERLKGAYSNGLISQLPSREHVKEFLKLCTVCQKVNKSRKYDAPVPRAFLRVYAPFEELSLDVIGPLQPAATTGYRFILAVIDGFSRFVWALPIPDTKAISAANAIMQLVGTFGLPTAFRWDNCSQFDNHLIEALTNLLGVERNNSVPYNPQSNGKIERAIAEIVRHLKFIVNARSNHEDWDLMLPMAVRILNSNKHSAIGLSPAEILLPGMRLDARIFPEKPDDMVKRSINKIGDKQRRIEIETYVNHLQELQVQAIKHANLQQQSVVDKLIDKSDDEVRDFMPGDWVVCPWRGGKPGKLSVTYQGPYKVIKKLSSTTYSVQDPADLKSYTKSCREMHRYHLSHDENPITTIAMDEVEELVEKILDYSLNDSNSKMDWDFLVLWQSGDTTWIPYVEARPLEAFDDYVKDHPELGIKPQN